MLTFAFAWIWLLLPLPLLIKSKSRSQGAYLHLPGAATLEGDGTQKQLPKGRTLLYLVWALLLLALARPQWLGEPIDIPAEGRDLMLSVDLSGSMQIEDMQLDNRLVDRFTLVQKVVSDFIERRKGDRIGLILFGDHAYLQAPLTLDRRSVAQFLREARIGLVGKQTAIGESIALAVKRFEDLKESNRVLILLTDGTNNAGNITPDEAATIAAERNITIYTIGVGAEQMERRTLFGKDTVNPSADLDEAQLKRIADTTGGKYFRARNSGELDAIYAEIDKLQPVSRDAQVYRPTSELFYWPLSLAALLSVLGMLGLPRWPTSQSAVSRLSRRRP